MNGRRPTPALPVQPDLSWARTIRPAVTAGSCEEWELDDAVYRGHGEFAIKIGVYPWGKTILEGTRKELVDDVNQILDEIKQSAIRCPSCQTSPPQQVLMTDGWVCPCGTRFFVRRSWQYGGDITSEGCWDDLQWALLHASHGKHFRDARQAVELIQGGAELADAFVGAGTLRSLHSVVYWVQSDATPRPPTQRPLDIMADSVLTGLGFRRVTMPQIDSEPDVWYLGAVDQEPVVVIAKRCWLDPDRQGVELAVGLVDGEASVYGDVDLDQVSSGSAVWRLREQLEEAWFEWPDLHEQISASGGWTCGDSMGAAAGSCPVLAVNHSMSTPPDVNIAGYLIAALRDGIAVCHRTVDGFRAEYLELIRRVETEAAKTNGPG